MTPADFPLRLTPFERYMLIDDRPHAPMTCIVSYEFDGRFERERLEQAVRVAAARHPKLRSTVDGHRVWRRPLDLERAPPVCWIAWTDEAPLEALAPIDLARGTGFRLYVQERGEATRIVAGFHHAVCDALGAWRFFRDLIRAYARRDAPARTAERDDAPPPLAAEPAGPVPWWAVANFVLRRPARIRAARTRPHRTGPWLGVHRFDESAVDRIRGWARHREASVNDLMITALFQTLAEWNAPGTPYRGRGWLRLAVPVNLRTSDDDPGGAENRMGYLVLDRRACWCRDTGALLAGVHAEVREALKTEAAAWILTGIAVADRVPGLLRAVLRSGIPLATALITNVGFPDLEAGRGEEATGLEEGPTVRDFFAAPPTRPGTPASFCLSHYPDGLRVMLRTDLRALDAQASADLLAAFSAKVEAIVGVSGGAGADAGINPGRAAR